MVVGPVVVDPGQRRGRGRPPKYGKNRIDLADTPPDAGLADRAFQSLYGRLVRQEVQDVLGEPTSRWVVVIRVVLVAEPDRWVGVLFGPTRI